MQKRDLDKIYQPKTVEEHWYAVWLAKGIFHAKDKSEKPPFSIVIPPPNITGSLHVGHALNNTLQDILVRWKRMSGFNTLWLPGTDHAGIATQNVVERQLMAEGTSREEIGREQFIKRVWKWRDTSGRTIISQLKRLGASCDWERERFTMDEGLSAAVREVFVRLYEDRLIYRGERLINWCPRCGTALSDIEVEHEDVKGKMYFIRYPLADDPKTFLIVATTRPETMLGDTAVAVHPEDSRYNKLIGREVLLPLTSRRIPIVGDPILVDREFGTGAVKITPGHDFNDEKAGQRHGLRVISILNEKGQIRPSLEEEGVNQALLNEIVLLTVPKARARIEDWLNDQGYLLKVEDHRHAIGKCYRCKTVVEPYRSPQWFVRMNDPNNSLAAPAIEAVRSGRVRLIPDGWRNNYDGWMESIQDWCISRQIWWGHQIPAWYCKNCNSDSQLRAAADGTPIIGINAVAIVSRTEPGECPDCNSRELVRDPDVLDTWFSSALWPFSTLGWPDRTQALSTFYPTSVLVTSFDILFFWVARMIMMGLKFMADVPFKDVYIHALVRDAEGQKMSKSKGNVIDPLEIMDKYGTDALRFTLASMASPGRDIKLSEERIEGYRNFANKIWNAARFALMNVPEGFNPETSSKCGQSSIVNVWIRSRLHRTIGSIQSSLEGFRFDEAAGTLYQFIWHEFCDWYLELVKVDFQEKNGDLKSETYQTVQTVFETILRLLHPFMPFITEELWNHFPHGGETITVAPYPRPSPIFLNEEIESSVERIIVQSVIAIRNLRGEMNISPAEELAVVVNTKNEEAKNLFNLYLPYINRLARISIKEIRVGVSKPKMAATVLAPSGEIYILLDEERIKKDIDRLRRTAAKIEKELEPLEKKFTDANFVAKAPPDVVAKLDLQRKQLQEKFSKISGEIQRNQEMLL